MAVAVFDADVLIGFRDSTDAHHDEAVVRMREASRTGTRRLLPAVTYAEVLIGPMRAGGKEIEALDAMLDAFAFELVPAERRIARIAASVRARTNLKLRDAFVVATALDARSRHDDVRLESFDDGVARAYVLGARGL